ncbi:MauE/DoxX family redox-associated membrane protein [Micromonospora chersina]|uniref:MauE/DoxX family redox-associated membrane protein n=1 Tax=Micromonospora chersina TaxID=47854 RepID=UPI003719D4C2
MRGYRIGILLSAALLLAFTVAVATNLRRAGATCRCYGRTAAPSGRHHVWRNAFLVGCAIAGALTPAGPVRPGEAVLTVAGGLLTGVLVVMTDDLRFLLGASRRT